MIKEDLPTELVYTNEFVGRFLDPSLYICQFEAKDDFGKVVADLDIKLLESRGLQKLKETPDDMLARINCLPTAAMVAINILLGKRTFGFGNEALTQADFYLTGVLSHLNDSGDIVNGDFKKGLPSFHYESGEAYHQYIISLARRFGLDGLVLTNFSDASFVTDLIKLGGIVLISLDNFFIRDVVVPELGLNNLSPGKHIEILHGMSADKVIYSDVANRRGDSIWDGKNRTADFDQINKYLTCPRKNDFSTRAIILFPSELKLEKLRERFSQNGNILIPSEHPILSKRQELSLKDWNIEMQRLFEEKGLAQWDLAEYLK
ncbi:MAG: hypothetical protein COU63_02395 [Candidatus Pacebacteria bacterium CG10_big_fil_rev_8_21_14_0_10_36_11]|nr:hypothetical protein [Candidatus Pacearchaeota archaeon]OIP73576.1 MAG: hypothetical protein AUK08_03320 [Candidatus Pacebacteria bacterium CG2_30_36_39]PIR64843.1 MAG: hypothetical protein COU63_02395 [Candidatus Pacebacteria bacterium CG10_big_fil_rev_8_21_14_0_10_36_11]PJC42464.1 MAG: hypothetical protein CO040_04380 [Candidatus Pacebacteria bacterium CG_4_9_14_0_2_um_filter_36_8]